MTLTSFTFDVSKLLFENSKRKINDYYAYIPIKYAKNTRSCRIRMPDMKRIFGIKTYKNMNDKILYEISLSFIGFHKNEALHNFYTKCKEVDKLVVEMAMIHSIEWFGEFKDKEVLNKMYKPILFISSQRYPPIIRIKSKKPISLDHERLSLKIGIEYIWFYNDTFGISIRAIF